MPSPVRSRRPSDSFDDDEPWQPHPPPEPPSTLMLVGVWLIFAPPLLLAVPVLMARAAGGFDALMRLLAGGYTLLAVLVLWNFTRRYVTAHRPKPQSTDPDEAEEDGEDDVWDEDAEAF